MAAAPGEGQNMVDSIRFDSAINAAVAVPFKNFPTPIGGNSSNECRIDTAAASIISG
jgi:hypothetical protein